MRPSSVRENGTPQCSSSYTASGALRHMYSMASWSPSQSDPLTVSYMCQRQSSSPMLPSAAAMPPCAATVWERVGNTLVMQAVLRPASLQPTTAGAALPLPLAAMTLDSVLKLDDGERAGHADKDAEERVAHQQIQFQQI